MRSVARQAALSLDWSMLEYKRPARLCVALGADGVLIGCGFEIVISKSAMWIMAVGTLDQALVDLVMKGHIEVRFHIGVALKAERGLAHLEQRRVWRSLMYRMATDTAHVCLGMGRAQEVWMSASVAAQASSIDSLGVGHGKIKDLGLVASRFHMRLAWSVATLACDAFAAMLHGKLGVWIRIEFICFSSMTSGAGLRTDIVRGIVLNTRDHGRLGRRNNWRIFEMSVRIGLGAGT